MRPTAQLQHYDAAVAKVRLRKLGEATG